MIYNYQKVDYHGMPMIVNIKMDKHKIKENRRALGFSQDDLAALLGVSGRTVQNWEAGKTPIPLTAYTFIQEKIDAKFHTNKHGNEFTETTDGQIIIKVPILPYTAVAKYIEENNEAGFFDEYEKVTFPVDKIAKGNYLGFKVTGDSMDGDRKNDTPDKAIVLGRELQRVHWMDGFNEAKYGWMIITNKNIIFKDIIAFNKDKGEITCHSRNSSPEYQDFNLSLNDVYQIFKIIKRTF